MRPAVFWLLASLVAAVGGFLTFALVRHGWRNCRADGWDLVDTVAYLLPWVLSFGGLTVALPIAGLAILKMDLDEERGAAR